MVWLSSAILILLRPSYLWGLSIVLVPTKKFTTRSNIFLHSKSENAKKTFFVWLSVRMFVGTITLE